MCIKIKDMILDLNKKIYRLFSNDIVILTLNQLLTRIIPSLSAIIRIGLMRVVLHLYTILLKPYIPLWKSGNFVRKVLDGTNHLCSFYKYASSTKLQ